MPPARALTTGVREQCQATPAATRADKVIIPWDHSRKDYAYMSGDYDFKGKLPKTEIVSNVNTIKGADYWNPVKECELCLSRVL